MFSESVDLYDLIYGQFKDYEAEAARIAEVIRELRPEASSVLDVGCGTGRHAQSLTEAHGFEVDGLDVEQGFVDLASQRCPDGTFLRADMSDFTLGRRYDVILCLFGSVGYVRTLDRLQSTARAFRSHVDENGLVLLEPWFGPDGFTGSRIHLRCAESEDVKVARASRTEVVGKTSILEFQYLVARADGIEHRREVHELGLFTTEEVREALAGAGLEVIRHDEEGLDGRGLFVATR